MSKLEMNQSFVAPMIGQKDDIRSHERQGILNEKVSLFRFHGYSMWPMLRPGDRLIVKKGRYKAAKLGDIVLFNADSSSTSERLTAHRVVRINKDNRLITKGDNLIKPDRGTRDPSEIMGQAVILIRKNRMIPLERGPYGWMGRLMAYSYRVNIVPALILPRLRNVIRTIETPCIRLKEIFYSHKKNSGKNIEQEVLAYSASGDIDSEKLHALRERISGNLNMDLLVDMAADEGLACLLYKNLKRSHNIELIPPEYQKRLRLLYHTTILFNLKLCLHLGELLSRLNQEGLQVVLLQGIALIHRVYEDPGLRPMTDIDLWVLPENYSKLKDILETLGYQRDPLYPHTFRKGLTAFDVHTHLFWADRIRARAWLASKGQMEIYRQTRVIDFEGHCARVLGKYDQILYLCLHALKHNIGRLIWLADIQALVRKWGTSDWAALIARAEELGIEKALVHTFYLLHFILEFRLPPEMRGLIQRKKLSPLERMALRRKIERGALPIWAPILLLSPEKGLRRQFLYFFETLFPRPEILRQVFPHRPHLKAWQLYVKRTGQLLDRALMSPLRRI